MGTQKFVTSALTRSGLINFTPQPFTFRTGPGGWVDPTTGIEVLNKQESFIISGIRTYFRVEP
jgi:hypothetical protein